MKPFMFLGLLLVGMSAMAAPAPEKVGGAEMPDSVTVGGEKLILNGAGLRKKFVVKVYAGALYLKKKSSDAKAVVAADEAMQIRMHFLYGVRADQLVDAWNEGFTQSLGKNKGDMQAKIDSFNAMFTEKTKKGDTYDVIYTPGKGTEVLFNGTSVGLVEGLEFKKAVFAIWLGPKVTELKSLKKKMING